MKVQDYVYKNLNCSPGKFLALEHEKRWLYGFNLVSCPTLKQSEFL